MANKQLGTRHEDEILELAAFRAGELDLSLNQYVNKILMIAGAFPVELSKMVGQLSKKLNTSNSELVKGILVNWIAKHDAQVEVYGGLLNDIKLEFVKCNNITDHYNYCKSTHVQKYEREILKTIAKDEEYELDLDDAQKRIAIKYRYGKAWLESDEYKKEQEIHAEIERFKKENEKEDEPELSQEELEKQFKE